MAAVSLPPSSAPHDDQVMDTRTPSPLQRTESSDTTDGYKPDLSQEVSLLSTKLVNAINYQTNLDDSLQQSRHELEHSQHENARLRAEKKSLDDMIANGLLVRKTYVDQTVNQLRAELLKERTAKEEAEKSRKQTENELENLTTALFEEANTMVAAARRDTEAVERRNSQLKSQIMDTEMLLSSQQEQLQDLKLTMEKMSERGETDAATARDSVPSTPIGSSGANFDSLAFSPNGSNIAEPNPEHPLYFSQLLTPVLRNDVVAYVDFADLLKASRQASSHSRAGSNGHSPANPNSASQTNLTTSTPALPGAFSFSVGTSPQAATFASTAPPLKDSKFYKRALTEDIEPTLRLDLAPGLSFLSRRTVLSSLLAGSMVVEPFMPSARFYGPVFACALCGEARKNEPYVRKHRFRTSEEESAQRYPLCDYCLSRIRAAGDFVGFLRMVRDGHWKAESEDEVKGAWEEAVRLRERMFWARVGGGVVPNLAAMRVGTPSHAGGKSDRLSLESVAEESLLAEPGKAQAAAETVVASGKAATEAPAAEKASIGDEPEKRLERVFRTHKKSLSISRGIGAVPAAIGAPASEPVPTLPIEQQDPAQGLPELSANGSPRVQTGSPEPIAKEAAPQVPTAAEDIAPLEEQSTADPTPTDATVTTSEPPPANVDEDPSIPEVTAGAEPNPSTSTVGSPEPALESQTLSLLSSPEPKPSLAGRRPSAVLARVREMEANASDGEKKVPGGFD